MSMLKLQGPLVDRVTLAFMLGTNSAEGLNHGLLFEAKGLETNRPSTEKAATQ